MKDPRAKKTSTSKRTASDSIPLKELLESADVYTLRNFLRNETKRNKQLTIRLKTRLIESASLPQLENKYKTLVSEIIREDVHGIVKLPKREVKLLHETISALHKLTDEMMATNSYRETYKIIFGILYNLHRYLDKTQDEAQILHDILVSTYSKLQALLARDLAPELRDDINEDARMLISKSYHRLPELQPNAISVVLIRQNTQQNIRDLLTTAKGRLTEPGGNFHWVAWYAILSDLAGNDPDVVLLMQIIEPSDIFRMAQLLFEHEYTAAGYRWVKAFESRVSISTNHRAQWKKWLFEASSETGQEGKVLDTGVELMLETSDYSYLERMKGVVETGKLASALAEEKAFDALARLYIKQGDWENLRSIIDQTKDIGLIADNLSAVVDNTENAEAFIRQQVHQFLTHRAGINCSVELNELLLALENGGYTKLATAVRDEIFTTYPDRFIETPEGLDISY